MEDKKDIIRQFYKYLWNEWDYSAADVLLSEDVLFRGSAGLTKHGKKGFIEYVDIIRTAFPDFHNSIVDLVSEGNKVVARLTYTGTHKGELFGKKPTGKRVEYAGIAIFTIPDDLISDVWMLGDLYSLMRQIDARA